MDGSLLPLPRPEAPLADRSRRLLAYVTDPESEGLLKRLATPHFAGVEVRRGGVDTAVRELRQQRSPDVLLVDLSGVALKVGAMERLAEVCDPDVSVMALGDSNDIALYRGLQSLGVAEYFYKPLPADQLGQALASLARGANGTGPRARAGKVVAVAGVRGGAGATTLAINLAHRLAAEGRRVALVDLDLSGGTVALGLDLKPAAALREALEAPERLDDLFLERAVVSAGDRLDVLAAEEGPGHAPEPRPDAVAALLHRLARRYHYVVADLPRGALAAPILALAGARLLVSDPSLAGARDALRLSQALGAATPTLVALNRAGQPGGLSVQDFAKALGRKPDAQVDWLPKPLGLAAVQGVVASAQCRPFRAQLDALAAQITGRAAPARPGLLARFRR